MVSDLGSFTNAGLALGRTQPAVSLQIKRLEEIVGAPLFKRMTGRRFEPTDQGEVLLDYARRILALNDEAVSYFGKTTVTGCVRLGIPNEFAVSFLPEILGKFAQSHASVNLEVHCDLSVNLLNKLEKGDFDLVVALHKGSVPDSAIKGWAEDLVWVTSPGYNARANAPLPLIVAPKGCIYRNRVIQTLDKAEQPWQIVYTSANYGGIIAAVLAGLGVTALSKSTVPHGLRTLGTTDKFPGLAAAEVGLHYDRTAPSEAVLQLVDYIITRVGHDYRPRLEPSPTP